MLLFDWVIQGFVALEGLKHVDLGVCFLFFVVVYFGWFVFKISAQTEY